MKSPGAQQLCALVTARVELSQGPGVRTQERRGGTRSAISTWMDTSTAVFWPD